MTAEKLSGSIWVSKKEWEAIKSGKENLTTIKFEPGIDSSYGRSVELTITAKMPEQRKREFTEGELTDLIDLWLSNDWNREGFLDDAFKEREYGN